MIEGNKDKAQDVNAILVWPGPLSRISKSELTVKFPIRTYSTGALNTFANYRVLRRRSTLRLLTRQG